jgi:uncharacterized protein (TIGR02246 family)
MMNRLRIGTALLSLFVSLTVFAQNRPTTTAEEDPAAAVRALEREWLDAYEKRDVAAMERIVADDFVIYFDDGDSQSKADILAMLVRGAGKPSPAFTTDDVVARVYGDTVILTGRVVTRQKRADGTMSESASRYTDVYVRRNGRWQVASSHLGKVKGEK